MLLALVIDMVSLPAYWLSIPSTCSVPTGCCRQLQLEEQSRLGVAWFGHELSVFEYATRKMTPSTRR